MKGIAYRRISILGFILMAASTATAFVMLGKIDVQRNGHLTVGPFATSSSCTCRTPFSGDAINCHDTQDDESSSAGGTALTGAAATSDGAGANTTGLDEN